MNIKNSRWNNLIVKISKRINGMNDDRSLKSADIDMTIQSRTDFASRDNARYEQSV